jgi:hypothetical protein
MTVRRGTVAVLLVVSALAVGSAGCGDEDGGGDRAAAGAAGGVGLVRANSTAQFASCGDWRRGTDAQRYATIADIRGQLTPQSSPDEVSDLSDRAAYRIFQTSCATPGADHLRLYKLYARAQAFAQFRTDADE